MGAVVDPAKAFTIECAQFVGGMAGLAAAGNGDTIRGKVGIVLIVFNVGIAIVGIDIVFGDVVHRRVGASPSIVIVVVVLSVVNTGNECCTAQIVVIVAKFVTLVVHGLFNDVA